MSHLRLATLHAGLRISEVHVDQPVVIGRRDPRKGDPPPVALHQTATETRLVVADVRQKEMSRQWMEVSPVESFAFELKNLHEHCPVVIVGDQEILPGEVRRFEDEILVELGGRLTLQIEAVDASGMGSADYRSLESLPLVPGGQSYVEHTAAIGQFAQSEGQEVNKMLQLALQVVQESVGSNAFFQKCASAAAEMVDLDRTVVLLRGETAESDKLPVESELEGGWFQVAHHTRGEGSLGDPRGRISTTLLKRVSETCLTVIHQPKTGLMGGSKPADGNVADNDADRLAPSLQSVQCAVASPILNAEQQVIGVIYGDRTICASGSLATGISDMEATLIEILAGALAGGLARRNQERIRNSLAEFFSPKVADQLVSDPQLMEAKEINVTALFCDIRKFSSVTEKLGPRKAIEWINDVMTELSQCVIDSDGVLVNYMGDEVFAMWGAPGDQRDHADRALECAKSMLRAIEKLRLRWSSVLPQKFGAGVGINTGPALVGNVGSRQKFQYGPLGNTVNLSSRLQSATKQLGVACLAGETTVRSAGCTDQCRRLAKLSVVGIQHCINVYEIPLHVDEAARRLKVEYEQALDDFENARFESSARRIETLIQDYPHDRPCRDLLGRVRVQFTQPSRDFDGVLSLTSK
ncbi:adenylate/guanylate cyclase domain-containing protein [Stieleria sp. ICT_E10.1]|uniref:adenylate/guanylate cyclase domain-containing protein n=1 Tax=Stieleria sedimenti TaxID=2976331 RepID=UPI00217FFE5A|nr:adenylate/guanylate cyclase domain-containing protein [Stieleria sedimenti]MCS7470065.1 adenylate/guanylate cyclase domain-containing protein [Stieleria sedimenti]